MCGIVGIFSSQSVNQDLYDALTMVQHRGQDAAGITTMKGYVHTTVKGSGLVKEVMRRKQMAMLDGHVGIGHVRYPTSGTPSSEESQPFHVNTPYGLSLVHNGNLTNTKKLKKELRGTDLRHINTHSDSQVLLNVLAHELQLVAKPVLTPELLFRSIAALHQRLQGAYSVITMINGYGLLAFRDPRGIRPLVCGKRERDGVVTYMVASESVALDVLGYDLVGDVPPGQAIYIDKKGQLHQSNMHNEAPFMPCLFEYIYLARPDSVLNGICVHAARQHMGDALARKIMRQHKGPAFDVVIPIPDTSRTAAHQVSVQLGVPLSEGFIKNRYIGRTFIMPGQNQRRSQVRLKLNAIKQVFAGKHVLLVDDSIVRGTTSLQIIAMARAAGATRVSFASAAPEVRYPNVYGIDMPNKESLVAYKRNAVQIAEVIQADWLIYQDLGDLCQAIKKAVIHPESKIECFEDSVFTGRYVEQHIDEVYLTQLAQERLDDT